MQNATGKAPVITVRASEFFRFAAASPEKQAQIAHALRLIHQSEAAAKKPTGGNYWAPLMSWIVKLHNGSLSIGEVRKLAGDSKKSGRYARALEHYEQWCATTQVEKAFWPGETLSVGALRIGTRWAVVQTTGKPNACYLLLPRKILGDAQMRLGLLALSDACQGRKPAIINPCESSEAILAEGNVVAQCEETAKKFLKLYFAS